MTQQQYEHWFQYFPKNFMWSQGFMSAIEMIPYGAAAMGEIQDYDMPGTQNLGDPQITFYQDYAAAKVYATFFALFTARSVFNLVVKADAGANALTNPAWTIPVFVSKKPLLQGKRGDRHMAPVTLKAAGLMTIATS